MIIIHLHIKAGRRTSFQADFRALCSLLAIARIVCPTVIVASAAPRKSDSGIELAAYSAIPNLARFFPSAAADLRRAEIKGPVGIPELM